ncbi:MAG: family 78 glycoside hydrolase catalytic domain [Oligoflexia bacterium]|nr:family 78 glycoside hydrolase catalytic domain [Oligoflexia bacterium]
MRKTGYTQMIAINYEGPELKSGTRYYWKVGVWDSIDYGPSWDDGSDNSDNSDGKNNFNHNYRMSWFEMGLLKASDWQGIWIGMDYPTMDNPLVITQPAPLLRKEFNLNIGNDKKISSARVYISGLGYYELRINGQKVVDENYENKERFLDVSFTNFNKRVFYATYDVTALLQDKKNVIGVELGRGFYALKVSNIWDWQSASWNDKPKMILQLNINFSDGTSTSISSDSTWKAHFGPTIADAIYNGDDYDAREEIPDWDRPSYNETGAGWENASSMTPPQGELRAEMIPPIRIMQTIRPIKLSNPQAGSFVFDIGKVIAGWVKIKLAATRGTKIKIKYGEAVGQDGHVIAINEYVDSNSFQTDSYIFKGEDIEVWSPKFSYKGFQYVEISGFPGTMTLDSLEAKVVHTAVETVGQFSCSNELINKIHENSTNSILGNLHGIPTDTPMYEKNGWMGDAHVSAEAAIYNFDMHAFYNKWLDDISDSQQENGLVPMISPSDSWGYSHAPEWQAAYPFILWNLYKYYDDQEILEKHYLNLKKYIEYEISMLDQNYTSYSELGDWLAPGMDGVPVEGPKVTATTFVYEEMKIITNIAKILGYLEDVEKYQEIGAKIKNGLNKNYLAEYTYASVERAEYSEHSNHVDHSKNDQSNSYYYFTEKYSKFRQTSNILPLAFDIAPEGYKDGLISSLIFDIKAKAFHLDTGILGTKYIFPVLSDNNQAELAYRIATQITYPSYGYLITNQGATSNWESWDLNARSHNHHMFGSIDGWFYNYLAGIRIDSDTLNNLNLVGIKNFTIRPYLFDDLKNASASIDTIWGVISSSWNKSIVPPFTLFTLKILVPINTTATVYIPIGNETKVITESGVDVAMSKGVSYQGVENGYAKYLVGSGEYNFSSKFKLKLKVFTLQSGKKRKLFAFSFAKSLKTL